MNFVLRMIIPLLRQQRHFIDENLDILYKRFDFATSWGAHPGVLPVTAMPIFDGRHSPVIDDEILNAFPDDPIMTFKGNNVVDVLRQLGLISDRLADTLLQGGFSPDWTSIGTPQEPPVLRWVPISGSRLPPSFEGKTFKDYEHLYYAELRPDPNLKRHAFEASQGLQRIPQRPSLAATAVPPVHAINLTGIAARNEQAIEQHVVHARQRHISSWAPSALTSTLG